MAWKVRDFECECGWSGEDIVKDDEEFHCPHCGALLKHVFTAANVASFSAASNEEKARILKKRSLEHTKREMKHDAEKFGAEGIKRAKAYSNPMTGYGGKGKR